MSEVGIFFLFEGNLLIESTPLKNAEPYGDHVGHSGGHSEFWDELAVEGKVLGDEEYFATPRGRVVYAVPTGEFTLYADRCVLRRPGIVYRLWSGCICRRSVLPHVQMSTTVVRHAEVKNG